MTKRTTDMPETSVHTAGPWGVEYCGYTLWVGPMRDDGFKVDRVVVSLPSGDEYRQEFQDRQKANARLIVAACNSYDRHFGEHAVSAAEGDLLGRALEALDKIHGWLVCHSIASADDMAQMFPEMTAVAEDILSQAREVRSS